MVAQRPTYGESDHTEKKQGDLVAYGGNMFNTAATITCDRYGNRLHFVDLSAGPGVGPTGELSGCIRLIDQFFFDRKATMVRRPDLPPRALDVYLCEADHHNRAVTLEETIQKRYAPAIENGTLRYEVYATLASVAYQDIIRKMRRRANASSVYGLLYVDPCRPKDLDWDPLFGFAAAFVHLDILAHLPFNAAKRADRAHQRYGFDAPFARIKPRYRQRGFVQEPDAQAQWAMKMWTNYKYGWVNHKRGIYEDESARGQEILKRLLWTHDEAIGARPRIGITRRAG